MPELLHAWALVPAAVGTCCLAADRGRPRVGELVAAALMLAAMVDCALTRFVPAVYWAVLLIAGALGLAAWRNPRRRRTGAVAGAGMTLHAAIGLVLMAALPLVMGVAGSGRTGHAHGGAPAGVLVAGAVGGALAYLALSVRLTARMPSRRDRAQVGAMALSVCLMAAAVAA